MEQHRRIPSLSDEQVLLIGEIMVAFGGIEGIAAFTVALLVRPDIETGLLVGAGDLLGQHLDRLQRLADYRLPKPLAQEIRSWIAKVRNAATDRNVIAHGAWVIDQPGELYKAVRRRGGEFKREDFDVDRLTEIRNRVQRLFVESLLMAEAVDMSSKWAVYLTEPARDRPSWYPLEQIEPPADGSPGT